ncbi:hypothetical protein QOZ80_7AG0575470 [Eleusine coracana subsp. coracana]|nr:hypothetical protein QOZ80_7AG0575470 [Eleusine coracana subsp. coracana]
MEEVAACDASSIKGSIPNAKGASLAEGMMARQGKAVMRPERTKEEEELKKKMDEYLRLSAILSDEEEEELSPSTEGIDLVAIIDDPAPDCGAWPLGTLQVFSFKVVGIRRGLQWPLDVFGMIAVRDNVDFNRNIIFNRTRDSCQTLTEKDKYLELAGPSRAVVWCDNFIIEFNLSVKGATKSEDKDFSFLAVPMVSGNGGYSRLFHCFETSKLSTLGITLGYIFHSVEATIFIPLIDGSLNRGKFAAFTTGLSQNKAERMDRKQIVLLDSGCEKVPIDGNGDIQLSRRVVSVEFLES